MLGDKIGCKACAQTSSGTVIVFVLEKAEELKNASNEAYSKKDFATATSFYTEGIRIQCTDKELVSKLYNNRSTVYFYLGNILNVGSTTNFLTEGRGIYGYPYVQTSFNIQSIECTLIGLASVSSDTAAILNLLDLRSIVRCSGGRGGGGTRSVFRRASRAKREPHCIFLVERRTL